MKSISDPLIWSCETEKEMVNIHIGIRIFKTLFLTEKEGIFLWIK